MKKNLTLLYIVFSCLILCPFPAQADKFFEDNDAFFLKYLKQDKFLIDTSAEAIVLYEYHSYDLHSSEMMMKHQVRRIIKIVKKSGSRYADINIALPVSRFTFFRVNKIHATTYNLDNGKMVKQEIDGDNISMERSNDIKEKKISLPAVHEGSVIDYTFETEQPNYPLTIGKWNVQENIPKLYSRVELYINHKVLYTTNDAIVRFEELQAKKRNDNENILPDAYTCTEVIGEDLLKQYWVRKNISAFQNEPYLGNENSYKERMDIRISGVHTLGDHGILNSWPQINATLVASYHFYRTFPEFNTAVKTKAKELAGDDTSELAVAKRIFKFVRDSITSSGYSSMYTQKDIVKVLDDRSGNSAEINFLLIALLRHAGLSCSPVILATKDNALPNPLEPELDNYDYTICQLRINDQKYYLDAAEKYNPFGRIPPFCLNGYARVIDKNKENASGIVLTADMANEKALYTVTTTDNSLNNYTLNFKYYFSDESSMAKRKNWHRDTGEVKKYITSIIKDMPLEPTLKQYKVINLADPEKQLALDFSISLQWPAGNSMIYLSPYAVKFFENAPFKSAYRRYPIEFPATENLTYTFSLRLPEGYTVDELPKGGIIKIDDNNQYKNMYVYNKETNTLDVYSRLQLQRIYYPPADYGMLQEMFQKMGDEQQKTLVIKKQS